MALSFALILILVAAVIGGVFGWLFGRGDAVALRAERDRLENDFRRAISELATESESREAAILALGKMEAAQGARDAAHVSQLAELRASREELSTQFKALGAQMLEAAQAQFLERADARFKQSEAVSGLGLKALLQPVSERLEKYEQSVQKVEAERAEAYGNLQGLMESMRVSSEAVRSEAARLGNSLRNAPKARGRWGEQHLRNVLESCGLAEHTDFVTEASVTDDEGQRWRPDAVVRVPGGKSLVIDAKVSFNDYQDAYGAVDEDERKHALERHAAAMRAHVNTLGAKAYWSQFQDTPEFVVMFVSGEHFMNAALEQDHDLWEFAFSKKVLLATPTNLIAIARTVSAVWQQEKVAKESRQISDLGRELYDRLAKVSEDFGRVGSSLNNAVKQFNTATNSFNGRLVSTGKKIRDLNIETGSRDLVDVPLVEQLAGHVGDETTETPKSLIKRAAAD